MVLTSSSVSSLSPVDNKRTISVPTNAKRFDADNYRRSIRSRINREITNNNLQKANDSKLFKKLANDYFEANKLTN